MNLGIRAREKLLGWRCMAAAISLIAQSGWSIRHAIASASALADRTCWVAWPAGADTGAFSLSAMASSQRLIRSRMIASGIVRIWGHGAAAPAAGGRG